MEQIELETTRREVIGKQVKQLRRAGWTPLVLLQRGKDSISLRARTKPLNRVIKKAGMNRIITVKIAGDGTPHRTIIKEIQRHPVSRNLLHIDLQPIVKGEKMRTGIPVHIVGESPLVKRGEGVLMYGANTIEIECLPKDLFHSFEVDASTLDEEGKTVVVKDLKVPEGITVLADPDGILLSIAMSRLVEEEEEIEVEEAYSPDEVEVIAKGEKEEEE